ncbi:MAG: hypothetical protein JO092_08940 [Candidatus Eremiobacteraeota bacterium]|nr:hypothetical protein [Candidatus Eremiobacteraeota bacterium]MBV8374089.1 hypothetical protein [Candidatus Eremiobacteraeota bacterium]
MRPAFGVVLIGALAAALSPLAAISSSLPASLPLPTYDLRAQLFLRLFGETTDWRSSVAAAYGDALAESPLRDLALHPLPERTRATLSTVVASAPTFAVAQPQQRMGDERSFDLAQSVRARLLENSAATAAAPAPDVDSASVGVLTNDRQAFSVAAYQPVQSSANVSLDSGEAAFEPIASQPSGATAMLPGASTARVSSPADLRVGPLRVEGQLQSSSAQVTQPSLLDSAYGAGANFAVRAGARNVDVGVSSSYEELTRNDAALAGSFLSAQWQLPGGDAPLVIGNSANMSRLSLGAGVAVPLVNGLTLKLNYDTARLLGSYGLPGLTNLDAVDNAYGGALTFAIPHSSSTLSFSAYQYRYQDNILNANSLTQTRENVNFTVKF